MGSAHSVSLQIYVFPFTCFAFSLFFCHFVSPSPSLPPSRAPHCAASSRGAPRGRRGEIGAPFRSPTSPLRLSRRGPLTGGACILFTRMSTSERRVGEGRFFFVSPPCLLFPFFYFAWRCAQSLGAIAQEGCWRCVNPFRAMPLHYRNKGCYPPSKTPFSPLRPLPLYDGTASWGGEVLFRFAPLSSFPLILFCLALCTAIACNCTRGVLALCVQYFVDASALRRSLERCRGGQRVGVGATAENTGATARKRGAFRTALRVRFREASTPCVVEPCRRRAQEEVERHGRERDKCRAKT